MHLFMHVPHTFLPTQCSRQAMSEYWGFEKVEHQIPVLRCLLTSTKRKACMQKKSVNNAMHTYHRGFVFFCFFFFKSEARGREGVAFHSCRKTMVCSHFITPVETHTWKVSEGKYSCSLLYNNSKREGFFVKPLQILFFSFLFLEMRFFILFLSPRKLWIPLLSHL